MAHPPRFWRQDGSRLLPALLSPLAALTESVTARRLAAPGWRAPVPVICCGNVTVGGAGKTTLALEIGRWLTTHGRAMHFLLRGYGGSNRGVHRVAPGDTADLVGDEALLLAEIGPTWVGVDRAASARAAVDAGADVLVMDDGLQNPTLQKDLSLLVVDGATGFGNGRVLPAGPLREPISVGAGRCQAAVIIGADSSGAAALLPAALPKLHARLVPDPELAGLAGQPVFAFAGIASPEKFFTTLTDAGVTIAGRAKFADHHPFAARELAGLLREAARLGAVPVTTAKDAVRLPAAIRAQVRVIRVTLAWDDPAALPALLEGISR